MGVLKNKFSKIIKQNQRFFYYLTKILVGVSATMCHSAEKIPAKEGCQFKRVSIVKYFTRRI